MFSFVGRRNVLLVMILIVTALMLQFSAIASAAPNSNSVEMVVDAGYEDVVKVGTEAPFYITLVNKGEAFSGEAQVIIDTSYRSKTVYATNFELPEGTTKKLTLNVPVSTANRKVQVRLESSGRTIKEVEYSFNKILSPGIPVIGVLGDGYNQLRVLNGLRIKQSQIGMDARGMYGNKVVYEEGMGSVIESSAEMLQLNKDTLPEDDKAFSTFDYIVIADYDTSLLSDKQMQALEKWVDEGNTLILAGGTNAKKVYSGLSNSLKPFEILGSKKESINEALVQFTTKDAPEAIVDISTGNMGEGKVLIGDETLPLAVSYKKSGGKILFVAFDPTMSPISVWGNAGEMWKRLINESVQTVNIEDDIRRDYYDYDSVVRQVPEDQTPPYKNLLLIILVYIILVGPLLYILLKWKDKRDYSWVIIPLLSVVCIGIIYAAGFRTRYTSAVMNNFSIIRLDSHNKTAEIQTSSGVFNNGSGKMNLEYSQDHKVDVIRENDHYYGYNYNYSDEDYKNAQIKSKIYLNDPIKHELYNVGLWEPCVLRTSQFQSYEGKLMRNMSINGNEFSVELKNDTGFAFEDSFIIVGENFVDVGNILPNEEKKVSFSFDNSNTIKNFNAFLDSRYVDFRSVTNNNRAKDWKEQYRKRSALSNLERFMGSSIIYGNFKNTRVVFVALNFENVDYGIKVNGKKAKTYNTNVVYATEDLYFQSGKRFDIPKGLIGPVFEGGEYIDFSGQYNDVVMVRADTEAFYRFELPKDIVVDKFTIDWSASIPEYLKEKYNQNGATQNESGMISYELFIYNNVLSDWESIDDVFEAKEEAKNYINEDSLIKIKIRVNIDESTGVHEYLWKPEISISGVKK